MSYPRMALSFDRGLQNVAWSACHVEFVQFLRSCAGPALISSFPVQTRLFQLSGFELLLSLLLISCYRDLFYDVC
jgi:hypothetical protein